MRTGKFPHDDGFCNWDYSDGYFCTKESEADAFYCPSHLRMVDLGNAFLRNSLGRN